MPTKIHDLQGRICRIRSLMGVSKNRGIPKWMVKIMENPMNKWMIWGFSHIFGNTLNNVDLSWVFCLEILQVFFRIHRIHWDPLKPPSKNSSGCHSWMECPRILGNSSHQLQFSTLEVDKTMNFLGENSPKFSHNWATNMGKVRFCFNPAVTHDCQTEQSLEIQKK